jgi:hypothetical protein
MFFLGAELCRLVYSDVVVIQESIKALGMSPDVLNGVISAYDNKYFSSKRKIVENFQKMMIKIRKKPKILISILISIFQKGFIFLSHF